MRENFLGPLAWALALKKGAQQKQKLSMTPSHPKGNKQRQARNVSGRRAWEQSVTKLWFADTSHHTGSNATPKFPWNLLVSKKSRLSSVNPTTLL